MFEVLKYESSLLTFTEIPDEISWCLNISGCPCNCKGCFEPWLAKDIGTPLTVETIEHLIELNKHVTCICFMGGDRYIEQIIHLIIVLRHKYPDLKWAMYSGRQEFQKELADVLDYYKVGPYIPELGPLNQVTTNQHLYKKEGKNWIDITYRFQQKKV